LEIFQANEPTPFKTIAFNILGAELKKYATFAE
jgi:hypothetical protein